MWKVLKVNKNYDDNVYQTSSSLTCYSATVLRDIAYERYAVARLRTRDSAGTFYD